MANTYVSLAGGLDLETPPIEAKVGSCLEALNFYESVKGGYSTVLGYERYDGQPSPSDATYYHVLIDEFDLAAGAVSTIVGATIVIDTLTLTVAAREVKGDGTQLVLIGSEPTGTAPDSDDLPLPFDTGASILSITALGDASTAWETGTANSYLTAAQAVRRNVITEVPGNGPIRGVAQIDDHVIAWRDDTTESIAYRDTPSGWEMIPIAVLYEVDVTAATVASAGDVCNSGNDIILSVHDYLTAGAPVATKRVYAVKRVAGSAPTAFVNDVGAVNHGTVLAAVVWSPLAGGKVNYYNHNFYAGLDTYNCYFADGVNCAMVYNVAQNVIQPISADYRTMVEVCKHVIAHNQTLFMSTSGGTFITSVIGDPMTVNAILLSQEIGVGDDITGFAATASDNLAIFTRNRTFALSGTVPSNWQLRPASKNSGSRDGCIAQTDDVFSSDDRGIAKLSRTDTLGGFAAATITDDQQSLFNTLHQDATCATTLRKLNQMRFYYGTRFLMASRVPYNANGNEGIRYGITEGLYGVSVLCASTEEDSAGDEKTFFGSTDGFVYQADMGASADGADMEYILSLHYNHLKSPLVQKRFVGVDIEAKVIAPTTMQIFYYMNDGRKAFSPRTIAFVGGTASFDSALFDSAVFDALPLTRPRMTLKGTGYNIQFSFYRKSSHEPQMTLTGYALRFKERGLVAI